jgi:hypothetical protein
MVEVGGKVPLCAQHTLSFDPDDRVHESQFWGRHDRSIDLLPGGLSFKRMYGHGGDRWIIAKAPVPLGGRLVVDIHPSLDSNADVGCYHIGVTPWAGSDPEPASGRTDATGCSSPKQLKGRVSGPALSLRHKHSSKFKMFASDRIDTLPKSSDAGNPVARVEVPAQFAGSMAMTVDMQSKTLSFDLGGGHACHASFATLFGPDCHEVVPFVRVAGSLGNNSGPPNVVVRAAASFDAPSNCMLHAAAQSGCAAEVRVRILTTQATDHKLGLTLGSTAPLPTVLTGHRVPQPLQQPTHPHGGVAIVAVVPGSPCAIAGVRVTDLLVSVSGVPVSTEAEAASLLHASTPSFDLGLVRPAGAPDPPPAAAPRAVQRRPSFFRRRSSASCQRARATNEGAAERMAVSVPESVQRTSSVVLSADGSLAIENVDPEMTRVLAEMVEMQISQVDGMIRQLSLPHGWSEHADPQTGQTYFYHAPSGRSAWERPQKTSTASGGEQPPTTTPPPTPTPTPRRTRARTWVWRGWPRACAGCRGWRCWR